MASTAIPFVFPAGRIDDDYLHGRLGAADRAAVAGAASGRQAHRRARRRTVRRPARDDAANPTQYPSFAQVAGHALSSVFLDNLGADLERVTQFNRLLDLVPEQEPRAQRPPRRTTSTRSCSRRRATWPSLALQFVDTLPGAVRMPCCAVSAARRAPARTSRPTCCSTAASAARCWTWDTTDAMARRDELEAFLAGETANYSAAAAAGVRLTRRMLHSARCAGQLGDRAVDRAVVSGAEECGHGFRGSRPD